jgi:hypothetical protein
VLEGDRSALRDIRRQVDSLRAGAGADARGGGGGGPPGGGDEEEQGKTGHAAAPPHKTAATPPEAPEALGSEHRSSAATGAGAVAAPGAVAEEDRDGGGVDIAGALKLPRYSTTAPTAVGRAGSGGGGVVQPPQPPFLLNAPTEFASSALARSEAERLRRERRALLGDGGAAYTVSHPVVRHLDRLTVMAERQAVALQARGL